jgi:hypothetical protein
MLANEAGIPVPSPSYCQLIGKCGKGLDVYDLWICGMVAST